MKNIWLIMCLLVLGACNEDQEIGLDVSVPEENITFTPVSGGAVMHYKIPENTEIYTIQASYMDAQGKEIVVSSSIFMDSLSLLGFNEAQENIPVEITFMNKNNEASAPMYRTFSTLVSGPYDFLEHVDVEEAWNGIYLKSDYQGEATGLVNVYYVGINAYTQKTDTLFTGNMTINNNVSEQFFGINFNNADNNTVVIEVEDYRGYVAHKRIWNGINAYPTKQLLSNEFNLTDPGNWSLEDENQKFGLKYLVDGDTKGSQRLFNNNSDMYFTYCTKNGAKGSYVLVDMLEPRVPASIRLYSLFDLTSAGLYINSPYNMNYNDRLPCDIKVYASNDAGDENSWILVGSYYTDPNNSASNGWGNTYVGPLTTLEQMNLLDPRYCEIVCKLSNDTYRYLKVQCDNVFNTNPFFANTNENISYHELEIYVKKEN